MLFPNQMAGILSNKSDLLLKMTFLDALLRLNGKSKHDTEQIHELLQGRTLSPHLPASDLHYKGIGGIHPHLFGIKSERLCLRWSVN